MFRRAFAGLNLTPFERAIMKLLQLLLIAAVIAALPIVSAALNQQNPDWNNVIHTAIAAVSMAVAGAFWKWFSAHLDTPLPAPQVDIQQTPAGLTVTAAAPQPAPTAPSTVPAGVSAL